jgi:Gpi18-like mannosyltransferase
MKTGSVILLAALLALGAKLYCAATTVGTNDTDTFYNFGRFIWENGLLAQYRATPEFNHTPLVGWFCAAIYGIGKGSAFSLLLRLPGIFADFFAIVALLRWGEFPERPRFWALLLFALSPVNFMVSGFHGNVDAVLAWLLLFAAREGVGGRAISCGLLFGLACQVKVIPLLLAPVFFFFWAARGRGWPFVAAAAAIILAGWSFPLLTIPEVFLRNVLGYSSNWGSWGITHWLHATGWPVFASVGFLGLNDWQTAIMSGLKYLIIFAAFALAWRRRNHPSADLPATLLLVWTVFFVFAPGFGAQYLVWFAPLLVLTSPRWFTVITAASTVFLFHFYNITAGGMPWDHAISTAELLPQWVGWSRLPWLTLAAFLGWNSWKKTRSAEPAPVTA